MLPIFGVRGFGLGGRVQPGRCPDRRSVSHSGDLEGAGAIASSAPDDDGSKGDPALTGAPVVGQPIDLESNFMHADYHPIWLFECQNFGRMWYICNH